MQSGSADISEKRNYRNDLLCLACLTIFVIAIFSSTIFSGKDISRIGTVAHRDTLFGRLAKGNPDPMDTCTYQEHAPNYLLTERIIASGNLPLWNPYLGLGCPLWADSQVLAFSPITWLQAPFASLRLYNLLMVFHVWLGCIGAYAFARVLRISPAGSLLASMSYGLCPNMLCMFEWNRCQSAFFPMPFLGFAFLWRRGDAVAIVASSVLCTMLVLSGHAVPSFFSIFLASLLYFALAFFLPQSLPAKGFQIKPVLTNFVSVGVLTLLLSAPFVVPFLEGVRASDTFKASQGYVRYVVRETALIPSIFFPFHGSGSPYPGAVSIVLASSAFLIAERNRKLIGILSLTWLFTLLLLIRLGPFDLILQLPYLNWFMNVYALPALLLLSGVLAGCGYDALLDEDRRMRSAVLIAGVALIPILMPFIFQTLHLAGRQTQLNDWLTSMAVVSSIRWRELAFIGVLLLVVFAFTKLPANLRMKIALTILLLNAASLTFLVKKSLPARPAFNYEQMEPISFLKSEGRRVISLGRHVLVPNTGQIFSISSFLSFMPTHPKGMLGFLEKTGVQIEGVGQYAERPLTKLLDIASVKYAIGSEPPLSSEDKIPEPVDFKDGSISFGPDLALLGCAFDVDAGNRDITGSLRWKTVSPTSALFMAMLVSKDGSLLWLGDRHPVGVTINKRAGGAVSSAIQNNILQAVIPTTLKAGEETCLILQVVDGKRGELIEPAQTSVEMRFDKVPKSILLKRFRVPETDGSSVRHFKLVKETAPEMVRVYENTKCLPEAYLVSSVQPVKTIEEAIQEMLKPDFDPRKKALVEGSQALSCDASGELVEAKVSRANVNEVIVEAEAAQPSLLVLTDVFFPGWRATVDGHETMVFRANAVLRSVKLEKGRHRVRFFYDPGSVKIGLALFLCGLATIFFLLRKAIFKGLNKADSA